MNTEREPTLRDLFPPLGHQIWERKFGTNPTSALVPNPVEGDRGDCSARRPAFKLVWEDQEQGLKVVLEERSNGHLIVEVFCNDASLPGKSAVSVGLVGTAENGSIRKTIPLDVSKDDGCGGSGDFGPLTSALKELGPQLAVVMFLLT